jgi:predicted acylesterase/phospholipase RssA
MENRRQSYDLTIPHISNRKELILQYLKHQSLTASEIANRLKADGIITFAHRSYAAPRLTELEKEEKIFSRGYRFCEQTQRNEAIYHSVQNWQQGALI